MKRTSFLLFLALPFVFFSGCIDGNAVLSLNKDGSGEVTFEGLFDYPAYCEEMNLDCDAVRPFFIEQIKTILTSGGVDAWSKVQWKFLNDGRCYFRGTAYFGDINKVDFFAGSIKSILELRFVVLENKNQIFELKLNQNYKQDKLLRELPHRLFEMFRLNLIATLPGQIEQSENFQKLDNKTVMFCMTEADWIEYLENQTVMATIVPDGNSLFDYKSQVSVAKKDYEKILEKIELTQKSLQDIVPAGGRKKSAASESVFNARLRQGLAAQTHGDLEGAIKIYKTVVNDPNADARFRAGADYQIGICLLQMNLKEQAISQLEAVINKYPLEPSALKAVKMLQDIRSGQVYRKEEKPKTQVVDTIPRLYIEDVDPNIGSVTVTFSEPMKPAGWFYSSFAPATFPAITGGPKFDSSGTQWTLPVRLRAGRIYAIALNCGDAEKKSNNLQMGFENLSGLKSEPFILVFATADVNNSPTLIDDKFIDRCEKINSKQNHK
ncbi:MAG: tetratricopeptide repeat protein [Phycisphaerae bacterium]|nr:tetratricopeptide repeat protein [Phycisphaerae bacterium]